MPWTVSFFGAFIAEQTKLGDKSPFKRLISSLPEDVSNFPIMWSETERNYFKGSNLLKM